MLEDVLELWIMYPLAYQLLVGQDAEVRLYILDAFGWRSCRAGCRQRALREDPAEDGGRLGYVLRILLYDVPGIDQRPDDFFDEEWIALCLVQDQFAHALR